ncbi:MAG: asparagine synthase (glutamine-hydrolyzing) [Candidatus Omnitrophica bacterium]|nr:asparagine synthase (glutamine-hydrolyzing) [Candidatus Omnitrophota bacterium]
MCGIYGLYNLGNQSRIDKSILEKMRDKLTHRGPDDVGIYTSGGIGLGHSRLSIIDRTPLARQPLSNENNTVWVVLNGEIYNYLSLKQELRDKNHVFRSNGDAEVIVHLYEELGEGLIERLRGMFVFALWDENKRFLFIARDRVGQKPLVYIIKDNILYFASEIKALRSVTGVGDELDDNSLLLYFSFRLPIGEQTMFKDIKRLLPGKYLFIENSKVQIRTYWHPSRFNGENIDGKHPERKLFSLLEESVELQMASDVPIGAFLSGGIDSSVITGLMSKHSKFGVRTFSIFYEDAGIKDPDSFFAEKVARLFKTDHKKISFNPDWIDSMDHIVSLMDEPYSNPAALSFYFLCKNAKKDVTVILSGDGGDEVFAGYSGYANWKLIDMFSRCFGTSGKIDINSAIIKRIMLSDADIPKIMKLGLLLLVPKAQKRGLRRMIENKQIVSKLFADKIKNNIEYGIENKFLEKAFLDFNKKDFIDNLQLTDLLLHNSHGITWMPDQIGMAHSLEIRAPFLDHQLIEFAFSLPSSMRIKGIRSRKYILKKSLENFLPKDILYRRKMGYGEIIPYSRFFRKEWDGYIKKKLFNGILEEWGGINMGYLHQLYRENLLNKKDHFETLWAVLILSIWLERVYKK